MVVWIALITHMVICFISYILIKRKQITADSMTMPMVFFIPIWGFLLLCASEIQIRRQKLGIQTLEVDHVKLLDKKYRHIELENTENIDIVVPLEEAMQVNDAKTRRALMLDVLHKNPNDYIGLFQRASMSQDTELTHYATTTIMEIQGEFEKKIQICENELKKGEDKEKTLREYREVLEKYIQSGLLSGNILQIQQRQLDYILDQLLELHENEKDLVLRKVENALSFVNEQDREQIEQQHTLLKRAKELWPDDERIYMLFVSYYRHTGQTENVKKILAEITNKHIYLSHEGKAWYEFWNAGSVSE